MLKLGLDFAARVPGGPAFATNRVVDVQALDRLVLDVARGTPLTVDLQPAAAEKVVMIAVSCVPPASDAKAKITAVVQDGAGKKTDKLGLDAPLLLVGAALALLPGAPRQMVIDYAGAAAPDTATIEIMIARTV